MGWVEASGQLEIFVGLALGLAAVDSSLWTDILLQWRAISGYSDSIRVNLLRHDPPVHFELRHDSLAFQNEGALGLLRENLPNGV